VTVRVACHLFQYETVVDGLRVAGNQIVDQESEPPGSVCSSSKANISWIRSPRSFGGMREPTARSSVSDTPCASFG
jgi:hypothetical protein